MADALTAPTVFGECIRASGHVDLHPFGSWSRAIRTIAGASSRANSIGSIVIRNKTAAALPDRLT
jgi:hypothetical protein